MKFLASLLVLTPALALPSPQEATPSAPSEPSASASDLPKCAEAVRDFEGWDLTSFKLTTTTSKTAPILGDRESVSSLSFSVKNPILDYEVECEAEEGEKNEEGEEGVFDGRFEFYCKAPEEVQGGEVVFSYDEESGRVHMKQRWTCYDDPEYPTYYTGTGEGTAEPECEEVDDQVNKDWKMGSGDEFSKTEEVCEEKEVAVELTRMEAIA